MEKLGSTSSESDRVGESVRDAVNAAELVRERVHVADVGLGEGEPGIE